VCAKSVAFIFAIDKSKAIYFAPLQSEVAQETLAKNGITNPNPNTFYYIDGEKLYSKSSGVLCVLRDTQSLYRWLYILRIIPRFLRDLLYDGFAKHRHRFFTKSACGLPSRELLERFIE